MVQTLISHRSPSKPSPQSQVGLPGVPITHFPFSQWFSQSILEALDQKFPLESYLKSDNAHHESQYQYSHRHYTASHTDRRRHHFYKLTPSSSYYDRKIDQSSRYHTYKFRHSHTRVTKFSKYTLF